MTAAWLDQASTSLLRGLGVPTPAAHLQAQVLVEAELRGHPSHGLLRLPTLAARIRAGLIDPETTGLATWRGTALLDVDGCNGLGPVIADATLDHLAVRARDTGVAMAAMRRTSHLGMLAFYAERHAARGQVVVATCTTEALVHPWGGRRAMVGTNPLAIGVPAQPRPLVLDMSTGEVSMGRILAYGQRGEPIPPGWALDADGEPTTDATAAAGGSLAPFGGAKGYALGLALEVLIAALTRTALGPAVTGTLDTTLPSTKGDLLLVVDAGSDASHAISAYLDDVRACEPQDPSRPVAVPGDRSSARRELSLQNGIDLARPTHTALLDLAHTLGVELTEGQTS